MVGAVGAVVAGPWGPVVGAWRPDVVVAAFADVAGVVAAAVVPSLPFAG